jgi:hypothetical protein
MFQTHHSAKFPIQHDPNFSLCRSSSSWAKPSSSTGAKKRTGDWRLWRKLLVAHLKLCASRAFVLVAYPCQSHEMLFDAHTRAFAACWAASRGAASTTT